MITLTSTVGMFTIKSYTQQFQIPSRAPAFRGADATWQQSQSTLSQAAIVITKRPVVIWQPPSIKISQ